MREIISHEVTEAVSYLFQQACYHLPEDVVAALQKAREKENSPIARNVLARILENAETSAKGEIPLCQDTGVAVVLLELGQEVHIVGGDLYTAVNEGVRQGYDKGYLRKSVVCQPFSARVNTTDNTPAIIHTDIVPGDRLKISTLPKGFGSKNMNRLAMLLPTKGCQGIIDYVVRCVDDAGVNPSCIVHLPLYGCPDCSISNNCFLSLIRKIKRAGRPDTGNIQPFQVLLGYVGVDLALTDPEHFCATGRAYALSCRLTIFHSNSLSILHLLFGTAFNTVGLHWFTSLFCLP